VCCHAADVLQYQHICAVLQQLNAPVVLLKVLNQDVLQSCNKSSDVPDLRYLCFGLSERVTPASLVAELMFVSEFLV